MADLTPIQKELLARADSIFKSIAETVSAGVEFAKDQIPDIAYQYIVMERVYLSIITFLGLLAIVFAFYLIIAGVFKDKFKLGEDALSLLLPALPIGIFGFVIFAVNLKSLIMVWFAPKIYIITNIIHLIKS